MAPPAGLLLPGGLQYFVDVLGAKSRYDIVLAYMGLMVVVTAACGLASRLLSGLCVRSYRSLSAIDKWDWDTRIGSSIHAALSTALALYVIGGSGVVPGLGGPLKGPACLFTSPLTWAAIGLSLGYFIADTFALAYYYPLLPHTNVLLMHHLVCLACLAVSLFTRHGHIYIETMVITEVTTPLINIRWFLDKAGMKRSLAYRVNGLSIVAFWFLGRICIFIPYAAHILGHFEESLLMAPPALLLGLVCPGLLATLNVMWFKQILRGAVKMLRRQDDEEDEGRSPRAAKKKQ